MKNLIRLMKVMEGLMKLESELLKGWILEKRGKLKALLLEIQIERLLWPFREVVIWHKACWRWRMKSRRRQ